MARFYIEWHGCSLNKADTEKLRAALISSGHELVDNPEKADFCIINTCAVKSPTEEKIISRLKVLREIANKNKMKIIVAGCLVEINRERAEKTVPEAMLFGVHPEELGSYIGLKLSYGPTAKALPYNKCISIIPVARGCLNRCSYCCVNIARGKLRSYYPIEVEKAFRSAVRRSREIWLTATDLACYGFDIGTDISKLIEKLLENRGDYRVRLGMLNPQHTKKYFSHLLKAMEDERVYKFFHIPVQSGSDRVLIKMRRGYKIKDFEKMLKEIRSKFPEATIATDIIVGFPGESHKDFEKTLELIEKTRPDIVNISKFGKRPGTAIVEKQLPSKIIKERSEVISNLIRQITLERNMVFVGRKMNVLFSEKGAKSGFLGRAFNYKPVLVDNAKLCSFGEVLIKKAHVTHLEGEIIAAK
ncbi:MAG: tRNA (N(6)-L-threonylcarbamoyladenosine(37)-C(2))-methylthiotransferase [Candidatus Diapherotrites archaeon]|nr:tRNA (N(6)-L-threonylcarbamoyladenosine(37)-C(2))-methylthiotransferase [Candidatus Diapherotrites archaeon]